MRTPLFSLFTVVQQQLVIIASEYIIFMIELKQNFYFTNHCKMVVVLNSRHIEYEREKSSFDNRSEELSLQYNVYIHNVRFTLWSTLTVVSW